ncbi:MAG TPA: hypothetical protein VE934_01315 [Polaromonas sp.]|uniref:aldose epimerase family protein n=1 Tax=Polaromonas sp. TaxID=1869339 RepID=UPI002D370157|nr:hypothetical protein [Polaromonas sp.]HYW55572.1 hypothetical protein [Polaromonas sp.]
MNALSESHGRTLRLSSVALELDVRPGVGGCYERMVFKNADGSVVDVLRPAASGNTDPFLSASFPLVPYSNRLFGGHLLVGEDKGAAGLMNIPLNRPGVVHPVHGVGWRKAWQVVSQQSCELRLAYDNAADTHWPFAHRCVQTISLSGATARFHLQVHNLAALPMPVGAGFHPYFATDADTTLHLDARDVWAQDSEGVPSRVVPLASLTHGDVRQGLLANAIELNHCIDSWKSPALLRRLSKNVQVSMAASESLDHLVVYRPNGASWICLEPVSHATGAFSLPPLHKERNGVRLLEPDAMFEAWMEISVTSTPKPSQRALIH